LAAKLYHRSVVLQRCGSVSEAGWTRSATVTVAGLAADGAPVARVPSTLVRKDQPGSASIAEWTLPARRLSHCTAARVDKSAMSDKTARSGFPRDTTT